MSAATIRSVSQPPATISPRLGHVSTEGALAPFAGTIVGWAAAKTPTFFSGRAFEATASALAVADDDFTRSTALWTTPPGAAFGSSSPSTVAANMADPTRITPTGTSQSFLLITPPLGDETLGLRSITGLGRCVSSPR